MPYLNKVMLIGNVGRDPEIKVTPSGKKRVSFSLATSKRYRDANGEQKEQTDWHSVVGWGKTADIVEQLGVKKGTTLYVEGEVNYRSWDDQNGQKRYATDINMGTFQLLSSRGQQEPGRQAPSFANADAGRSRFAGKADGGQRRQNQAQQQQMPMDDDDLPF